MRTFSIFIERVSKYVTNYPKVTIVICFAITAIFATQLPKLTIDADLKRSFPQDFPVKVEIDDLEDIFGGSEIVLVGIEAQNIYEPGTLELIQRISEEIEEFDGVDDVTSIFTVSDIVGSDEGMEVNDLIEEIPETEKEVAALRTRMRANKLYWNNIISEDETATAIIATMSLEAKDEIVYAQFQDLIERESDAQAGRQASLYLGGMLIVRSLVGVNIQRDMAKFMPVGMLLMLVLLFVSFRSVRGMLLPFSVVIMSLICTFGLMAFLGRPITMLSMLLPAMLIAITNDYSIHIVARYYEDVQHHLDRLTRQNIVIKVMTQLGIPILLAGVTTVAGFASLLTHILIPAKELGVLASFGITLAFIFSMTFVPAWLSLLPIPKVLTQKTRKERLEGILLSISNYITRHPSTPKFLFGVGVVLSLVLASGIPKIVIDTNEVNFYADDHPLVVSTNLLNSKLGGAMSIDVVFDGDIKDPQVLKKIQELQEYMDTLPYIGKTTSMVDYLKMMNKAMHANDPAYYTIPESRALVAQYLLLYSMSGDPEDFDDVVDYEYKKAHLIGRINESGTREISQIVSSVEGYIEEHWGDVETPKIESLTGFSVLFNTLIDLIVWGQVRSLLLALLVVFVVGVLVFRSFVGGLFTIYPISIAMLLLFGLMGYLEITLNMATAMLSSILIGVGVDYTIHFLYHYREEIQQNGRSAHDALRLTFTTTGKGIIYNAMSVVVGFCVLMLSDFFPVYFFGWLLTVSILACLIGALTLLPAAVLVFKPKFIFSEPKVRSRYREIFSESIAGAE